MFNVFRIFYHYTFFVYMCHNANFVIIFLSTRLSLGILLLYIFQ
mgnify:CR=1 FL=1